MEEEPSLSTAVGWKNYKQSLFCCCADFQASHLDGTPQGTGSLLVSAGQDVPETVMDKEKLCRIRSRSGL